MTAEALLSQVTQAVFVLIFLLVVRRAVREPRSVNFAAATFFGVAALLISIGWIIRLAGIDEADVPTALTVVNGTLLISWAYPLLWLAFAFTGVRRSVMYVAAVGLALSVAALVFWRGEPPPLLVGGIVVYFVTTVVYASARFLQAARASHGVPGERMRAAAAGSGFVALLMLSFLPLAADPDGPWASLGSLLSLAAAASYYVAFAPPAFLRDMRLVPELRRLVSETVLATPEAGADLTLLARGLEASVSRIVGAPTTLALADPLTGELTRPTDPGPLLVPVVSADTTVAARSFQLQRAIFDDAPGRHDPANAELYEAYQAHGVMAVPITLGERRFGVLVTTLDRPTLFAEDDLGLLEVLADRLAAILRSREVLSEAAEVEAERESLQLKDEFLAAVAHDLKTPLTTLVGQSQLLSRRALRDPNLQAHMEGIGSMLSAAQRMQHLVDDVLDSARADHVGFVKTVQSVELLELVHEAVRTFGGQARRITVEGEPAVVTGDRDRIVQVIANLLDNALKYSPVQAMVGVTVGSDFAGGYVSVRDTGAGIAPADLSVIFERFRRGARPSGEGSAGLGLGLYICKRIAEEHGGAITVSSKEGAGSTFTLGIPIHPPQDRPAWA